MKDLIEYIARSIVEDPEQVTVREVRSGPSVVLELKVAPDDMGKVIGKQGRVAQAMRSLLRVASSRRGMRASLEIG